MPREGKSLVSANLAMAYAQSGLKTLLIDGDMRNARQEEMFRVDTQAPGLAEALRGDVSLEEAVTEVGCENLSLLAAGRVGRSPSDLLNTKAFTELLAEARQQYDQVIIDSPPVNAVNDARIISTLVDAVVVVLRRDESRSSAIKAALEGLDAVHAPVLGVVLNGQVQTVVPYPYSGALISKTNWETPQADWKVDRKTNGHANGAAVLEAMAADD